jgi:hypothetical protein
MRGKATTAPCDDGLTRSVSAAASRAKGKPVITKLTSPNFSDAFSRVISSLLNDCARER